MPDPPTVTPLYMPDVSDADRLLFVTPRGYPVRHKLFYKRVFRPTIEGRPAAPAAPSRRGKPASSPRRARRSVVQASRAPLARPPPHGAALNLAAPGANLATVKERLGHENIATTVDLCGKRVPSVDAALPDAVGASIFAPPKVTVLAAAGMGD